jgi:hypothetical protein
MTDKEEIAKLITDNFELKARSYSGRCMYGEDCLGFHTNLNGFLTQSMSLIRKLKADEIEEALTDAVVYVISNVRTDSLGREEIFYFPSLPAPKKEDEDEDENSW